MLKTVAALGAHGTYRVVGSRVLVFGLDGNGLEHGDGRVDIQFQTRCNLCHLVLDLFRLFFCMNDIKNWGLKKHI